MFASASAELSDAWIDGDEQAVVAAGGIALVPAGITHEVRNDGAQPLRFVAVCADTDVVTRCEDDVQPDGSSERCPVA